jgi:hypothetical protein
LDQSAISTLKFQPRRNRWFEWKNLVNTAISTDAECAAARDRVPRRLALLAIFLLGALALAFFLLLLFHPADLVPAEYGDMPCWSTGIRPENLSGEFPADDVLACRQSIT